MNLQRLWQQAQDLHKFMTGYIPKWQEKVGTKPNPSEDLVAIDDF